ncbi:MAG TPA: peptidoglycan-binding domain-containing protein [Acidobacteriaceae bacterium]|nr:peptidoglycan-binding domain-containing protein [Acidobacteriaceae bacterium]
MFSFRACQAIVLGALLIATPSFATRTHRSATSGHARHHHLRRHAHEVRGQRQIDPERAKEIQDALIREHYLSGPASGEWDATTEAAMEKYQSDHGWQTKLVPDSRALIKLGLGPKDDAAPVSTASVAPMSASAAGAPAPLPGTLADAHSIPY